MTTPRRSTDQELEESLRELGCLHPIVRYGGKIYDGERRQHVCDLFGLKPKFYDCSTRATLLRVLWLVEPDRAIAEAGKMTIAEYAETFNAKPMQIARHLRSKKETKKAERRKVGRRYGSRLETLVTFWCSQRLKYIAQVAAARTGRSVSDYIRQAMQDAAARDVDKATLQSINRATLLGSRTRLREKRQ